MDYLREWLRTNYNGSEAPLDLPKNHVRVNELQNNPVLTNNYLWCCKKSIDSAMYSTRAFDGVANPMDRERMRVTNIHGTATA